jgi:hypothetical protein
MGLRQQGYDEHASAHHEGSTHERPSPANSIDQEKYKQATSDDLDDSEEASDEQFRITCTHRTKHL